MLNTCEYQHWPKVTQMRNFSEYFRAKRRLDQTQNKMHASTTSCQWCFDTLGEKKYILNFDLSVLPFTKIKNHTHIISTRTIHELFIITHHDIIVQIRILIKKNVIGLTYDSSFPQKNPFECATFVRRRHNEIRCFWEWKKFTSPSRATRAIRTSSTVTLPRLWLPRRHALRVLYKYVLYYTGWPDATTAPYT